MLFVVRCVSVFMCELRFLSGGNEAPKDRRCRSVRLSLFQLDLCSYFCLRTAGGNSIVVSNFLALIGLLPRSHTVLQFHISRINGRPELLLQLGNHAWKSTSKFCRLVLQ